MLILKERRQNLCVVAIKTARKFPPTIRFLVFNSTIIPCFFINYNIFSLKNPQKLPLTTMRMCHNTGKTTSDWEGGNIFNTASVSRKVMGLVSPIVNIYPCWELNLLLTNQTLNSHNSVFRNVGPGQGKHPKCLCDYYLLIFLSYQILSFFLPFFQIISFVSSINVQESPNVLLSSIHCFLN